jgi:hypothetical protein
LSYTPLAQRVYPINDYRHTFIRINSDSRIRSLVCAREGDETRRSSATATGNLELMAALDGISELSRMGYASKFTYWVELGTRVRVRGVQRNYLMADEVVSIRDTLGHSVCDGSTSGHEGGSAPSIGGADAAIFLDLEPHSPVNRKQNFVNMSILDTYWDPGIQLLQPVSGHFAIYVMVGPTWLSGHRVQYSLTSEPAVTFAWRAAGEEPGRPPSA